MKKELGTEDKAPVDSDREKKNGSLKETLEELSEGCAR